MGTEKTIIKDSALMGWALTRHWLASFSGACDGKKGMVLLETENSYEKTTSANISGSSKSNND